MIINTPNIHTTLDDAMDALVKLWSKDYRDTDGIVPCDRAKNVGLSCFSGTANWTQLKRLNHPAILKLTNDAGAAVYAIAVTAHADTATVIVDQQEFDIPIAELESTWHGEFLLLWRRPEIGASIIAPGMQGVAVNWLLQTLKNIEATDEPIDANAIYDDALRARVRTFQRRYGLGADGIVGDQTMIQLIAAANSVNGPRLVATTD